MKKRKHQLFAKYAGSIADKLTTKLSEEEIMEKEQEFERIKSFMANHDIPRLRSILFNQTELNNEAEELYKQIDKAQVHLINARLSNDEQGNKSAISEMETAMCDAMQLLKCFIDRKDKEQKTDNVNHPSHYTWPLAYDLGFKLDDVAQMNINKLKSRQERGKLSGSGDNR